MNAIPAILASVIGDSGELPSVARPPMTKQMPVARKIHEMCPNSQR
jgi:hypothetical protein